MKIPAIKKLAENHKLEELKKAEESILEETAPDIEVDGNDAGEQLTHVIAAIEIVEDMRENELPFNKALRNYTKRVRDSIS